MSSQPFFSVVMPTYNRAQFLPLAIKSVLQQTFEDFELIISNGGSTDNTNEIVASFSDSRIRYFESKERLSIGNNYQTAFDQAGGEYITFLGDDDAYVATLFEQIKRIIEEKQAEIVSYKISQYYHDDYLETDNTLRPQNSLFIPEHTNEIERFDGKRAADLLFNIHGLNQTRWNRKFVFPALANAVYHNEVFSRISRKNKHLFAMTPADMYLAAAVFYVTESYYCLDKPLLVWSRWSGNSTASPQKKGAGLRKHYENLLNGDILENTPLKFPLPLNCSINAILQAKNDFAGQTDFDWKLYYKSIYSDLLSLQKIGIDVAVELKEFEQVLLNCPNEFRQNVQSEIYSDKFSVKKLLKDKMPGLVKFLTHLRSSEPQKNSVVIEGKNVGFGDVLQAAKYLDKQNSINS